MISCVNPSDSRKQAEAMNSSDELLRGFPMKKNRGFISVVVLMAMVSLSCAQTAEKKHANPSTASTPELRWKYESGG